MLARSVRSGLVESWHRGEVVAARPDGEIVARWGSLEGPFFFRSAAKPFQATVSREQGARLSGEELAVACASHSAEPVHLALVRRILAGAGIPETALACPPAQPLGPRAADRAVAAGKGAPRPVYHNCSGKHAAMLAACAAQGWPLPGYHEPDHPLQLLNRAEMAEVTGDDPGPVGVDGCGVPTFRVTVAGMARAYARLAVDDRYAAVRTAMHRYPLLTAGTGRPEARLAATFGFVAKGGAQGCLGVAVPGRLGLAAKSEDGSLGPCVVAVAAALGELGLVPETLAGGLDAISRIPVLGRGEPVGALEPAPDMMGT